MTIWSKVGIQLNTTHFLPTAFVKSFSVSVLPVLVAPNAIELTPILSASMTLLLIFRNDLLTDIYELSFDLLKVKTM